MSGVVSEVMSCGMQWLLIVMDICLDNSRSVVLSTIVVVFDTIVVVSNPSVVVSNTSVIVSDTLDTYDRE